MTTQYYLDMFIIGKIPAYIVKQGVKERNILTNTAVANHENNVQDSR